MISIKSLFSKQNIIYTICFVIGLGVVIVNRCLNGFNDILWIIDVSTIFSLLYVVFIANKNMLGILFNLIATIILVFTNFYQHIWFNFALCLFVNAPSLFLGFINWLKSKKNTEINNEEETKTENKNLNKKQTSIMYLCYLLCSIIGIVILYFLNGNLFYLDAFYSVGCAFGVILCSKQYIDQFLMFFVANCFGVAMYILLTIQNVNNLPMIFLVLIFIVVNTLGYFNWKKNK